VSLSNSLFFEESQQPHQLSAFRSFTVRSRWQHSVYMHIWTLLQGHSCSFD
jgi:hypothetical protein